MHSDGGSAFPVPYSNERDGPTMMPTTGMTLRDYMAAKAMQGILAARDSGADFGQFARACYIIADAMLKERINAP